MSQPLIGITTYHDKNEYGFPTSAVQTKYIRAVVDAGGAPILIPNELNQEGWKVMFERLDGILFTGGGDIACEVFNGEPHPRVGEVDASRDELELPLLRAAVDEGKPFMGICRGLQMTNVALGGTLYTHIEDQFAGAQKHDFYPKIPREYLAHPVRVEEGSRIAQIFGEPILQVNSLHHQGIKELAPALKPVAFAPDGIIEAVELPDHPFGFAVQWHPEWLQDQPAMRKLFMAFVEAAAKHE